MSDILWMCVAIVLVFFGILFVAVTLAYIDYYNNRRIKARLKGLPPALHRQQALSAA